MTSSPNRTTALTCVGHNMCAGERRKEQRVLLRLSKRPIDVFKQLPAGTDLIHDDASHTHSVHRHPGDQEVTPTWPPPTDLTN